MTEPKITIIDLDQLLQIMVSAPDSGPLCDFCSGGPVVGTHVCEPSVTGKGTGFVSEDVDGLWAVCAACDELVKAENWEGLLQRSLKGLFESYHLPFVPAELAREIRASHQRFISTRKLAN